MTFSITIVILIITVGISMYSFQNLELKHKLMFNPYSVKHRGEWYRFISHGFIHGDTSHLFINMFVLYQFGNYIESWFGRIFGGLSGGMFVLFYLSAIIVSCISTYLKSQDNPNYNSLGASGATSAMVLAFVIFNPWEWFIFPPLPSILFAVAYLFYSSYMDKRQSDNIGHNAHFWGAVYGFAFVMISIMIFNPPVLSYVLDQLMAGPKMPSFLGGSR